MNKLNFYTSVKHFYISLELYKFKVNPDHHSHTVYTTFFFKFIYFGLHLVFVATHGLSLVAASGATLR